LRNEDAAAPNVSAKESHDVNTITQERSRGDAYVRLLTKPDEEGSRKHVKPYQPLVLEPDDNLLLGDQFFLKRKGTTDDAADDVLEIDDSEDSNMIFSFVRHNRYEPLESMLQQDSDSINSVDRNGNTMLHIACQNNHRRIAKLLIRSGIELDAQNHKGNTALHYCYGYNFGQLAAMLQAKGADDSLLNEHDLPPSKGIAPPEQYQGFAKHQNEIERAIRAGNPQALDPAEKWRPK